jgi:phthiodiolone/phenolphthiodiolone dimycocerosates ketoreductase
MQFGVGVTEPIRRHPLILAQAAITLAHLSRQPPIIGIGAGERLGTVPHGMNFSRPVSRLEESLRILRLCFDSSDPIDFDGRFYQLQDAVLDLPVPEGRKPQIWVAAHGPRMLELAGRYGDGWYPVAVASPDDYAARLEVVRASARDAGRNPDAITPAFHAFTVVAPTEEEANAMLDTEAARFVGLLFPHEVWQAFGLDHPLGKQFRGYIDILPETYDRSTVEAAIAKVPREMMDLIVWGSTEQVIAKL